MKKIITAINNPKLNEELKRENNFEIIGKDIQYREAILETLEKNNNIDLIIISEKILGEIKFDELIENIKIINQEIKIVFILEKENNDLEKILLKNNIKEIYYNNKIDLIELIEIINKKEINMEEEIIKLKKIIEKENTKNKLLKNKIKIIDKIKNKSMKFLQLKSKKVNKKKEEEPVFKNRKSQIISFSGNNKSGKTTLSLIISQCLTDKKYKVLLIDADFEKNDLSVILRRDRKLNYKRKKYKNKRKINLKVKKLNKKFYNVKKKINYYKIEKYVERNTKKLNKDFYFFNGLNNKEIKDKNLKVFFKIIEKKYNFIIIDLSNNRDEIINREIIENSYTNFILLEPNLLGIKEVKKLLEKYILKWKINKNSIFIIENKKSFISVNKKFIFKYLSIYNKIFEIRENKFYYILLNHYYKRKILIKNKAIKYDLNKILKKITWRDNATRLKMRTIKSKCNKNDINFDIGEGQ